MDALKEQIIDRLEGEGKGYVFTRKDFQDLAPAGTVGKQLQRMTEQGTIRRIGRGLFDYPKYSELLGIVLSPDLHKVAEALARKFKWSILPCGALAANRLGISLQVPAKYVYLSNGPTKEVEVNDVTIGFKHARPKEMYPESLISGLVVQALRYLGRDHIDDKVIKKLKANLSSREKKELLENVQYNTEWIYEIIQDIAKS